MRTSLLLIATTLIPMTACQKPTAQVSQYEPLYEEPAAYQPAVAELDAEPKAAWMETTEPQPLSAAEAVGATGDPGINAVANNVAGSKAHLVQPKDTLYSLARRYYNDPREWKTIFLANQNVLKDPNRISIGMTLIIP